MQMGTNRKGWYGLRLDGCLFWRQLKKIEHLGRKRPNVRFASRDKKSSNLAD